MIHDLDTTLARLLEQSLPQDLAAQVAISFVTPDDQFPPMTVTPPVINLFLYDVRENVELRNFQPLFERTSDGRVLKTPRPARIDCSYLVTVWAKSGVPAPDQDEHRILGETMKVLALYREIPPEIYVGAMKDQPYPIRAYALLPPQVPIYSEFWQALGGRPRVAVNYTVTITVESGKAEDIGAVVTDLRVG